MSQPKNSRRIRERRELKLPVRVRCRETGLSEWTEVTRLTDVTPFGAGFTLKRPTEKGRLLHMTIPMPRQLRVFDHVEDQYRVWALVRYVRSLTEDIRQPLFEVGVAFIGKKPPLSYETDPSRRYDISQTLTPSMSLTRDMVNPVTSSDQGKHTSHHMAVDLFIEVLDENNDAALTD